MSTTTVHHMAPRPPAGDEHSVDFGTAVASDQLPLFEGFRVDKAAVTFSGGFSFTLLSELDVRLVEALRLDREVTVTLHAPGCDPINLAALVKGRSFTTKDGETITTTKIVVDPPLPKDY